MLARDKSQVSLRVPAEMVANFDRIAATLERDRTWVMLRALNRYLEDEGAEILDDAVGIEELARGESTDLDEVIRKAESAIGKAASRRAG